VRVILDTNIFVSMMMGGYVGNINDIWRAGKFRLIVSDEIVSEYLDVLQRPKLHLSAQVISIALGRVHRKAEFVTPGETVTAIEADPTDNKFLEAALEGKADCIVSGDDHLLELKTFRGIPILTAREFIGRLESGL
jgi:putative PIN family toxin of toxin-antitoxin system